MQNAGLNGGADGDDLIRVDALVRLLAEELLHDFLDLRHARHAADQNDFADFSGGEAGILERLAARLDGALDEIVDQRLELGARQLHRQMLRTGRIRRDERQVDFGLRRRRQLDLGLFRRFLQALQRQLVLAQVDALLFLEFVGEVVDQTHVEVFAAEERVAVGRLHFEDAVADFQAGDVEGAAAEIVDGDDALLGLVEAVGERRRGRLVDDAENFKTGNFARVFRRLALRVVEIGGNGDDGLIDGLPEIGFRGLLHFLKREGGDLRRRIGFAVGFDPGVAIAGLRNLVRDELLVLLDDRIVVAAADETLDREDGLFRIGHRLALGWLSDETFVVVREGDNRRRRARAFSVLDDFRCFAFHNGNARISGAEVDPDDLAHICPSSICGRPAGPN